MGRTLEVLLELVVGDALGRLLDVLEHGLRASAQPSVRSGDRIGGLAPCLEPAVGVHRPALGLCPLFFSAPRPML